MLEIINMNDHTDIKNFCRCETGRELHVHVVTIHAFISYDSVRTEENIIS